MKKLVILSVILAGTISVVLFISLSPEKIITFITDNFTEYRISCEKIRLNTVNGGYITGLYFDVPDENITISADSVEFEVSMKRLLKDRQLAGSCLMKGVSFSAGSIKMSEGLSPENLFFVLFSPKQEYETISFSVFWDKEILKISEFKVDSDNVRIGGEYIYFKDKDEISVDLKISFSPEMYNTFEGNIKDNVLSVDEDGWYATIIDYKGNPAFLMALYAITTK